MKKGSYNKLSRSERDIIINKGTEAPFSGKYDKFYKQGVYLCRQCNAPLYRSEDKFKSSCGWPSFDDEIKEAVRREPDADGKRTEILCVNCGGHLGHVFKDEGFTEKNIRHCVNSASMVFISAPGGKFKKAYFAGGCFWGVEYHFEKKDGVKSAVSGYMGGAVEKPTYRDVGKKKTGHLETVEITYNSEKVSYEELAKLFFEIHDPTQTDGQGPDKGPQYLSAIFYNDGGEKKTARKLIDILKEKKYKVVTKLLPLETFWKAEDYHQDYYRRTKKKPYCHTYNKKF